MTIVNVKLKETANYKLTTGASVESGNPCYQITNKNYGVIEVETYMLPQALKYISDLEAALAAQIDIDAYEEPKKASFSKSLNS